MAGKILKGKLIGVIGDKVGVFQINASGERTPTIGRLVIYTILTSVKAVYI